jgi:hypothetical protein
VETCRPAATPHRCSLRASDGRRPAILSTAESAAIGKMEEHRSDGWTEKKSGLKISGLPRLRAGNYGPLKIGGPVPSHGLHSHGLGPVYSPYLESILCTGTDSIIL